MITSDSHVGLSERLEEVRQLCPELRIGQMIATIAMLGEDTTGRSLRDLDDSEFFEAIERFAADLRNRTNS
jgi:hypothetical protein